MGINNDMICWTELVDSFNVSLSVNFIRKKDDQDDEAHTERNVETKAVYQFCPTNLVIAFSNRSYSPRAPVQAGRLHDL